MTRDEEIKRGRAFQRRFHDWCEENGKELPATGDDCETWATQFLHLDGDEIGYNIYVEDIM